MKGEEAPEQVQEANDARWQEYGKLIRMERKLQRKILEDLGKRSSIPEHMFPAAFPKSHPMEWGGMNGPGRTQDRGNAGAG